MKVLLVKTSSLGDVVHALPAVTEALAAVDGLEIDWVVEEGFADIPRRHPGVRKVISVAIRRWRKDLFAGWAEFREFRRSLQQEPYDLVLDSQGLLKSAVTSIFAHGPRHGFDRHSARESAASWFYQKTHAVAVDQHAITRQKRLFGSVFGYEPGDAVDFGLRTSERIPNRLMFLHGTTWASKEWPESYWCDLASRASQENYELIVPAGDERERLRAESITASGGRVLFRPALSELMDILATCSGVVSVDTGLGHLAPALDVPVVGLFGATSPALTGMYGQHAKVIASTHLPCIPCRKRDCQYNKFDDSSKIYPPCYEQITPEAVWQALQQQTGNPSTDLV